MEELSQYDLQITHRKGRLRISADTLSRNPDVFPTCSEYRSGKTVEERPCGGCRYCTRAHENWSRFSDDVDDVLLLSVREVCQGGCDEVVAKLRYT